MGFGHVFVLRFCALCARETRHIGSWCTSCNRDNPAYRSLNTHHSREVMRNVETEHEAGARRAENEAWT